MRQRDIPDTTYSILASNRDAIAVSAVSWAAIIAGATATIALTLALLVLGTAIGATRIESGAGTGPAFAAFGTGALLWLAALATIAAAGGGFLTGRLRTRWPYSHADEIRFRDLAHGFLAWALATLLMLAAVETAPGPRGGVDRASAAAASTPAAIPGNEPAAARRAIGAGLPPVTESIPSDSPGDPAATLNEALASTSGGFIERDLLARSQADHTRMRIAELALWLFVSLSLGAGAACVAAVHGGRRRER